MDKQILDGVRILEWTIYHVGPWAGAMLGDLGAEVIKIEERIKGDPFRGIKKMGGGVPTQGPHGLNLVFESTNRNKKSIALDLANEQGREIVYRLVEKSDIFLTNIRMHTILDLRMDYKTLYHLNPKLIYVRASAYGSEGPDADQPGMDRTMQARSGVMRAQREQGEMPFTPYGIGDQMGSITAAYGALAALVARERLGVGQEVNVSGLGGLFWLQALEMQCVLLTGQEFKFDREKPVDPMINYYQTRDGEWIALGRGGTSDPFWAGFCGAIGRAELAKDPRFRNPAKREENSKELVSILDQIFAEQDSAKLVSELRKEGVVFAKMNTPLEASVDPQVVANDYVVDFDHPILGHTKYVGCPAKFSETPSKIRSGAPEHGQHTEEILLNIGGYSWEEISRLKEDGAIL